MRLKSYVLIFALVLSVFLPIVLPQIHNIHEKVSNVQEGVISTPIADIPQRDEVPKEKPEYCMKSDVIHSDWIITTYVSRSYTEVLAYGNITIKNGGTLVLIATTLKMVYGGPIYVESGGNLTIISSTITDYNTTDDLYFWIVVEPGGYIKIVDSTISYAGYQVISAGIIKIYALNITGGTFYICGATFTNNYYGILINNITSGVIKDTLVKDTSGEGLWIKNSQNVQVTDSEFYENSGNGVKIESSSGITLTNIKSYNNSGGLYVKESTVTISNVDIRDNANEGMFISSSQVTISDVTLSDNGRDMYLKASQGTIMNVDLNTSSYTAIFMEDISATLTIQDVKIFQRSGLGYGIYVDDSSNVNLNTIEISGDGIVGVYINNGSFLTLNTLRISGLNRGIEIRNSHDIKIFSSGATNANSDAVRIIGSYSIDIYKNAFAYASGAAIYADNSYDLNITQNVFYSNDYGVYLTSTVNSSIIYNNDFIDNKLEQAVDQYSNYFDNGTLGNYWSDAPNNTTYTVDNDTIDNHPKNETLDKNPPTISIDFPLNDSSFNTQQVYFNWTATDDFGIKEFMYSINGSEWVSLGYRYEAYIEVPDGKLIIEIKAEDWAGNTAVDNVTIHISAPPEVTIDWPRNGTLIYYYPFTMKIEVKDNTKVERFEIYWNDTLIHNQTVNVKSGVFEVPNLVAPDGFIRLSVVAYDIYDISESKYVEVNIEAPPKLKIIFPESNQIYNTTTLNVTWYVEDNSGHINRTRIYVDGEQWTTVWGDNFSKVLTISEGIHNMTIEVFDDIGKWTRSTVYNFRLDVTPPKVLLITPSNETTVRNSTVVFYWNLTDASGLAEVKYALDDSPFKLLTIKESYQLTFYNLTDGQHYLKLFVKDIAGNSKLYTIGVNVQEPPKLFILNPQNNSIVNYWDVNLTWKAWDNSRVTNFTIYFLEHEKRISVDETEQDKTWVLSIASLYGAPLDDGSFTVFLVARDASGNTATYKIHFTIVAAPWFEKIGVYHPIFSEYGPEYVEINNTYITLSTIRFRLVVTDNEMNPIAVWARLDFGEWRLIQNSTSSEVYVTFEDVNEGKHFFWFKLADPKGNTRVAVVILIVDFTPPTITCETPVIYTNNGNATIRWSAWDNAELFRFEVYINGTPFRFLPNGTRSIELLLPPGVWEVEIRAFDVAGNSVSTKAIVYVDKTPPTIKIISPKQDEVIPIGFYEIKWNVSDNYKIDRIEIFLDWEHLVTIEGNASSYELYLNPGAHVLLIKVYDAAGNKAYDMVSFAVSEKFLLTSYTIASISAILVTVFVVSLLWYWGKPRKSAKAEAISKKEESKSLELQEGTSGEVNVE